MRKATTHFLESGSAGVLRYQSNLQDKAKRSEILGCDYETIFLARFSISRLMEFSMALV